MIVFLSEFSDYYNKKINIFLTSEFFEIQDTEDPCSRLSIFFPDFLIREQKEKCLTAALDLYYWSGDGFKHELDSFHEYGLYNFLYHMKERIDDDRRLGCEVYYDNDEDVADIKEEWSKLNKEDREEMFKTLEGFRDYLHDVDSMIGNCFDDIDFITFPELLGGTIVSDVESMPIDLVADYESLLPQDIASRYKKLYKKQCGSKLFDDLCNALKEFSHGLAYNYEYKLFWNGEKTLDETGAKDYLGAILKAYFSKSEIVIDREVDMGTGKIDFKLYRNKTEKVLIEVKLASSGGLLKGVMKQLIHYMDTEECSEACYVIICYTEKEIQKSMNFVRKLPSVMPGKDIFVKILDATKKIVASELR